VFITQTLDADHHVLAHTLDLVRGLAERFDEVVVLCASVGRHDVPANVRVRVYGAPRRLERGARFLGQLAAELRRQQAPDAVLAHMVPLFLLLAWPLAKPRGVTLLLWYTHGKASHALRLAAHLADAILSADARSFPLRSPKVRGIGHAIDTARFAPIVDRTASGGALTLLALGRFSPVKGYSLLLDGFQRAVERGLDARLELRGPQLTDAERRHHAEIQRLVQKTPALRERVTLATAVAHDAIPDLLRHADGVLSATQARDSETFDKVVCEAAACGVPVLSSNTLLRELLGGLPIGLQFDAGDAESLASSLLAFSAAGPERRHKVGDELRRRVIAAHSVESWSQRVAEIVAGPTRE
jgi:glycosyltransferase involved in cell wall biosynthesis